MREGISDGSKRKRSVLVGGGSGRGGVLQSRGGAFEKGSVGGGNLSGSGTVGWLVHSLAWLSPSFLPSSKRKSLRERWLMDGTAEGPEGAEPEADPHSPQGQAQARIQHLEDSLFT